MGDVQVVQQPSMNNSLGARQTIQIVVVDERGSRANCKLYKSEKLSEILKKYNTQLKTNYDTIMLNNAPISLAHTPALLGLEDGQILQFCKNTSTPPSTPPVLNSTLKRAPLGGSSLAINSAIKDEYSDKPEQRIAMLEKELESVNVKYELLQNQMVNLENKLAEEQEKTQCRICFERHRDTVVFPCLHFAYCGVCLDGLNKQNKNRECPSCRGHIAGTLHIQIG